MALGFLLPVALLVIIATKLFYRWKQQSKFPYPPGPKSKFLIGNLFDFPKTNSARVFAEWGKTYNSAYLIRQLRPSLQVKPGGILSASAFGLGIILINDAKIAEDLLEKRPGLYNDRTLSPIVKLYAFS